jgi:galactoside O-acetyltransferase
VRDLLIPSVDSTWALGHVIATGGAPGLCPRAGSEGGSAVTHAHDEEVLARIANGLVYTESEAAFQNPRRRTDQIFEYNHTPPSEPERRRSLLVAIFGPVGERTVLLPPFHAGSGSNVHIGDDFFGNVNLTFVDDVDTRMGDGVMIAPSVTLTTTGHPVHHH